MNTKFDELAKGLAQSGSRRQALKKFGIGLAGMALACFGLVNRAEAAKKSSTCNPLNHANCPHGLFCCKDVAGPGYVCASACL